MAPINIRPDALAGINTKNYRLDLGGHYFDVQGVQTDYSIRYVGDDTLRFELRDGDQADWDKRSGVGSERDQIASKTLFSNGTPVEINFDLNIAPGAPNTAKWLVLGQLHLAEWTGSMTGASPPMGVFMVGERMCIDIRYNDANGAVVNKVLFADLHDIQRGHEYKMDIKAVFDPGGNGRLVVSRDGVTLVDYSGPMGYTNQTKAYWAEGLYRDGAATDTLVAEYGHLQIKTGAAVTLPDKSDFIDAPKLAVDKVGAASADGSHIATLSGSAKAGTNVTVFSGDTKLGVAKVDAEGHFTLNVKIAKGAETLLSSIATDSTGRNGLEAKPIAIEIGTGAEIGARLKDIVARGDVAKIVITDGTVLTVSSGNFSYISKYGQETLSKIQGNFSFYQTTKVTGQSYDQQDFFFDAKGTLLEKTRLAKGVEVYSETYNADGSRHIVSKNDAGGTNISNIDKSGVTTRLEQYDAKNKLIYLQIKNLNGSSESHAYNPVNGSEKYTLSAADGSRVEGYLGLAGRAFTKEVTSYDKAGKMAEQARFEADGTKIFLQAWNADGSRVIHNYDGVTGKETSFTVYAASGARTETTLKAGQPDQILKVIKYDAAGKVVSQTAGGTLPPQASDAGVVTKPAEVPVVQAPKPADVPVVQAPKPAEAPVVPTPKPAEAPVVQVPKAQTTYTVDAKSGLKIGSLQVNADGSKSVTTFKAGHEDQLLKKTVYDAAGRPVLDQTFDGAGKLLLQVSSAADGSHVNTQFAIKGKPYDTLTSTYDASGKVVASTQTLGSKLVSATMLDADGTKLVKDYAANGSVTQSDYAANGKLLSRDVYDAKGSHLSSDVRATDGSRTETTYGIKNQPYVEQSIKQDAAGRFVEKLRYYGDADHTLAFHEKVNGDGSGEVHSYDTQGRETAAVLTAVNKSKDAFVFSYSGQSDDAVRSQQDHFEAGKKIWTDVTEASGSHTQISYGAGTKLVSHDGVTDFFTSGGRDTFGFEKGSGKDVIRNFTASGPNHDMIEIDHAGINQFSDLQITASGRHTVITYGAGDSITLYDVAPSQLKPDFFLFN